MTTLTITHTMVDGTVVTGDPRPHHAILKARGFRYSGRVGWYIRGSRDRAPQTATINAVADELRAVGFTVEVEIDSTRRSTAEVEADRAERLEDRQEALAAKAERKGGEAEALLDRARQMQNQIPLGQPILVGHHSERRHRNHIRKTERTYERAFETHDEAEEAARKAKASEANQRQHESLGTTRRRIDKLEADLRGVERRLAGEPCPVAGKSFKAEASVSAGDVKKCPYCSNEYTVTEDRKVGLHYARETYDAPPTGERLAHYEGRKAELVDQITYWKDHIASLEENGQKVWGPDDFAKGDLVKTRFGWHEVVRVNRKSVSVKTEYSWTDTVGYDRVLDQRRPSEEAQ